MGMALMAVTGVMGAVSSIQQANAQASAIQRQGELQAQQMEQQALVARQNADIERMKASETLREGSREEARFRAQARQFSATQMAQLAASGVQGNADSALLVQQDTMSGIEEDANQLRYNTLKERWGYQVNEANYVDQENSLTAQAGATRQEAAAQARATKKAGMWGAVGGLLSTSVGMYGQYGASHSYASGNTITIPKLGKQGKYTKGGNSWYDSSAAGYSYAGNNGTYTAGASRGRWW